jgi:hypothetical protein
VDRAAECHWLLAASGTRFPARLPGARYTAATRFRQTIATTSIAT